MSVPVTSQTTHGRSRFDLTPATDTDHAAIHRLLRAVLQRPSAAAFQSQIDAPQYDPTDRLVVKRSDEVIAHVHLVPRILKFGGAEIRATDLRHLATLPEYRDRGLANRLLENALDDVCRNGSVVATTQTSTPELYRRRGWVTSGRHSQSEISPRDLLAHLEASRKPHDRYAKTPRRRVCTRHWRQHELDQISEIYDAATDGSFGPLVRRQSHWRWLMSRRSTYDQAFVAFESDRPCQEVGDNDTGGPIVGYAVMRDDRIIEFATRPGDVKAIRRLLGRTCQEAIENGRHAIGLVAPIDHPSARVARRRRWSVPFDAPTQGRELMARVLDPAKFLQLLKPTLWERVRDGAAETGSALQVALESASYRFSVNKRSVAISQTRVGEQRAGAKRGFDQLRMASSQFDQLLLGYLRIEEEVERGTIYASSQDAVTIAKQMFPQVAFWRPLLDDVSER